MNLFANRARPNLELVERVKEWARGAFGLPPDAALSVTELRCAEPDCPPVETVIAVPGPPGAARLHKLPKALAAVTHFDVLALAARGTHG
jgi:hypothetical protein